MSLSVVLVLAWIAAADGQIAGEEEQSLRDIARSHDTAHEVDLILDAARGGHVADLQLACEVISDIGASQRRLFLQMAIGVALEDGYLVTAENHILRFLADLLKLGEDGLNDAFREMTGRSFPEPSDASRAAWWRSREETARSHEESSRHRSSGSTGSAGDRTDRGPTSEGVHLQRLRDLATLGLDEHATPEEIKTAYRRMAHVHHPDKYSSLGEEAVAAAEHTFRRILAAYQRLGGA
jgi:DnaJ like chaperone protein